MAVTASVTTKHIPYMANHSNNAISEGATRQEVLEEMVIGVEFVGGPSFVIVRNHLLNFLDDIEGI